MKDLKKLFYGTLAITALLAATTTGRQSLADPGVASASAGSADSADSDDNFDRMDGMGKSGKRVDVIEWEGNLEIHVYPKGGLAGLALKLDDRNKDKPVMVIGYRFSNDPSTQLIRRAILGITLKNFKVYKDPTEAEFDKVVISSNVLSGDLVAFRTDPEPKQLYPDGHPALAQAAPSAKDKSARAPAAKDADKAPSDGDDSGTIKPFFSGN